MANKFLGTIALFSLTFLVSITCLGQKKNKKLLPLDDNANIRKSDLSFNPVNFKNVNEVYRFYHKKKLSKLKKYDRRKDWETLFPLLDNYVKNFGIKNFQDDTYWIWRLAKINEFFGQLNEARRFYSLALKHHRQGLDIKKVELHYDSLNADQADLFVPLEYYYELVEFRKAVDTLRPPRGVLLNMGEDVNSKFEDYGPAFSGSDDVLLFTSKRNQVKNALEKIENEDLFLSKKNGGYWQAAESLGTVNSRFNEGSPCISRDGNTLYFARCESPGSFGNCDIFTATRSEDGNWGNVTNLGANVNSSSWDSHPSLSHTGDTLYFASDRIGGLGLSDIYFTYKTKGGQWTKAKNLGPTVNTRNNELSPFHHPLHQVLYFSSNGHLLNFGNFDIFKSYKINGLWAEPKNIGPLVNGTGDEYYFTIDSQSKDLFYARSVEKDLKNLDLYSFPLPMGAQPEATTHFEGMLIDEETNRPLEGIVTIIDLDNGIEVSPKFIKEDGSFSFDLINNNNYLLVIQGDDYFRIEEIFYLNGDAQMNLKAESISSRIKFASIEFENGKAELLPEMFDDLNKVINFLLDNPTFKLNISGHTDSDGSEELNQKLSQDRAEAIMSYIVNIGSVSSDRITAQGFGSSKPIVDEKTAEDKTLNRRVEFNIIR